MQTVDGTLTARHAETAARVLPKVKLIIGADERSAGSGGVYEHVNPSSGQVQAEIPLAGSAEVDAAVAAATAALKPWQQMTGADRRDILMRFATLVRDYDKWQELSVVENGMPALYAAQFADSAYAWCSYYAGWADKLNGEVVAHNEQEGFVYSRPEPYGVVASIITWNAPLLSLAMKLPPALAAGNTIVLKPAESTPFTAMIFSDLARQAGIPDGVINVVPGGPDAGEALVRHPGVHKVSFTGGPPTAQAIMRGAADNLTPVLFELGGKGANIVFDDANLAEAVPFSCMFAMANTGQGCALPTRMLVQRGVYDDVVDQVRAVAESLVVGDPLDMTTYIGPLINEAALTRVQGVIESAVSAKSGRLVTGGRRPDGELASGYFIEPTLFADVDPASDLAQREIFGPVLSIIPFDTEEQAVEIANSTAYGLTNYIQSQDSRRVNRLIPQLNSGTVAVNGAMCMTHSAPFGGNGISGFGREGGKAGIDEFVRVKTVLQR
ncbi:aldehyde dehydrogenase family protein [Mycolicibacterium sp. XJ1819]